MLDISIFRFQKILGPDIRVLAMAILIKICKYPTYFIFQEILILNIQDLNASVHGRQIHCISRVVL